MAENHPDADPDCWECEGTGYVWRRTREGRRARWRQRVRLPGFDPLAEHELVQSPVRETGTRRRGRRRAPCPACRPDADDLEDGDLEDGDLP